MASVEHTCQSGATSYYGVFRDPSGRQRRLFVCEVPKGASRREHAAAKRRAELFADEQRAAVRNGAWIDPRIARDRSMTVEQLVARFIRDYRTRSGSMDYYHQRAAAVLPHLGSKQARHVTVGDVDRFVRLRRREPAQRRQKLRPGERPRELSDETLRKDLCFLSKVFSWARDRGLVDTNPASARLVRRPPKARPNPSPLSDAEVSALLEAAPAWLRPMIELGIETGIDRGELVGLEWGRHLDTARMVIHVPRGKTGVPRAIPYQHNATIRRVLELAAEDCGDELVGPVFRFRGGAVNLLSAKTALPRAWRRAGIAKPKPWKSLRATFATRKAERGVDVPAIAALMGLTTSHVLEHYVKPSGLHLAYAMSDAPAPPGGEPSRTPRRGQRRSAARGSGTVVPFRTGDSLSRSV